MKAAVVVIVLGLSGFLPALVVARRSPALIFLAPIGGALMAAAGAEIEFGIGGSLPAGYLAVAAIVNIAVIAWWLIVGRSRPRVGLPWLRCAPQWYVATLAVIVAGLALPLSGLRGHAVRWDTNSIWLTHALLLSGGHQALLAGLTNPSYLRSGPDYPPLVPAAGALSYAFFGRADLFSPIVITELLAACGLGLLGTGIAAAAAAGRRLTRLKRLTGLVAAGLICLAGFSVSGVSGISGYADLPWAAFAVAAIVWGLVLPRSNQALAIAWIAAAAASLSKNEGLATALALIILIALRYRPLRRDDTMPTWIERAAFMVVPASPGLIATAEVRLVGIGDGFFRGSTAESLATRASATIHGMADHLAVAPVALGTLIVGSLLMRRDRRTGGLGNPLWLWAGFLIGVAVTFVTYLVGTLGIGSWLRASVDRTMIFGELALYAEIAIWALVAVDMLISRGN
jgi:hypothetical protein